MATSHSDSHGDSAHHDGEHEHHDHSIVPQIINLFVLFALTGLTYGVALLHLGHLADIVALAIALTKASLVILIFMHVKEASRLVKVTAFSGFFWVFLFFAYLIIDVEFRDGDTFFEGWQDAPRKVYEAPPEDHH